MMQPAPNGLEPFDVDELAAYVKVASHVAKVASAQHRHTTEGVLLNQIALVEREIQMIMGECQ